MLDHILRGILNSISNSHRFGHLSIVEVPIETLLIFFVIHLLNRDIHPSDHYH
jgi:hypothetical protein